MKNELADWNRIWIELKFFPQPDNTRRNHWSGILYRPNGRQSHPNVYIIICVDTVISTEVLFGQETQDTPFQSRVVKLFLVFSMLLLFFVLSIDIIFYGTAEPL